MPSLIVDGYPIAYAEAGAGEPLLLVHGTLGDQRSFAPQMEAFGAHYHVMALSMRHCWPGQWEEGGDFTIARHVADVAGFIRSLGGPVRLLGHSRGGHIAFRVAERHPELIRALILAEPGGELDETLGGAPASGEQAGVFAAAAALIAAGEAEAGLTLFAAHTGGPGAWERRPEERRVISRDNARTLLGQKDERRAPYSRAAAEAVRAPSLLLGGDSSQPQFATILDALEGVLADTRRVTIPHATHNLNLDNPEAFNRAVLDFLAAH
ncbi:alpha/beta hydrolase [Sediminicoccus sp. KRV36]|uniref:alpha/beta fold hydrolase n=1 Tax=Sediminicoccus sp. KRV36 TaxID=3133721 RepID=UPI00201079DF|nr:alpha/beta hydrolase [Sediminicoccus rosea]UPY36636.1 alpha/beta hydrolase [Sediminicoccus rosea]